jgi:membrane protease YdiL (CAAX protease family)
MTVKSKPQGGMRGWAKRRCVALYFALVYSITWVGVLAVAGPEALRRALFLGQGFAFETLQRTLMAFCVMFAVPAMVGVSLAAVVDGREGLRDLLSRMGRWRVGARWYAVALLTTPLLLTTVLLALSLLSPDFLPGIVTANDGAALLIQGVAIGLLAGFFEEIGWSGFAVPRLLRRHGVLATGLMVGVSWGSWHFMADLWGTSSTYGALWLLHFLLFVTSVTAYRVLMVWVYDHTQSLLLMQLMHAFYSGVLWVLGPSGASGAQDLLYSALFAAALWVLVVVAVVRGSGFVRRPLQRQVS